MSVTQFISDWNDSLEFEITVAHIKKPTQSFLFGVLNFFLNITRVDCDKLKAEMDERHYKIWMVKYFNDFFKTCNPKLYPFIYGDLLKPDSKKVLEILRFFLNYHLFVKAVQKDVVDTASNKIETYNQLLSKKNQLQVRQEEARIQSENKEKAMKETTRLIAEYKQLLEELQVKSTVLTKDLDVATEHLHRIKKENIELTSEIRVLEPLIVSEEELDGLKKSIKNATDNIAELEAVEENIVSKNKCFSEEMHQLESEIEQLSTNINESVIQDSVEKCREALKNLVGLKNKVKEFQNQFDNATVKRDELIQSTKHLEDQLLKKRKELSSLLENCQTKTLEMESACKRASIQATSSQKKLELKEKRVEQLILVQENLIARGIEVIEIIESSK